ncbi:hypothetical protein D9757_009352 [Collybiopsis confluens]|uniref:BTB domain-containing protein n=1 Tax=Collybiopsis confluens TaxID=2823264 RepID=A0A8H5H6V6_9AGAR|nr:hypothetical protein D9757_009352 [Collybiopsis confluens]
MYSHQSSESTEGFTALRRHDEYFLIGGDLFFLIEQYHFRVHRYFFERESQYFKLQLANPASPGTIRQGTSESTAIVLDNIKAENFAKLLWVFYNPKYSLYKARVYDWVDIMELAHRWGFHEVMKLATREIERLEMPDIDRVVAYHKFELDRRLLLHRYAALTAREEPLTLEEGNALGMETTVKIFRAREVARAVSTSGGSRDPTIVTLSPEEMQSLVLDLFEITEYSELPLDEEARLTTRQTLSPAPSSPRKSSLVTKEPPATSAKPNTSTTTTNAAASAGKVDAGSTPAPKTDGLGSSASSTTKTTISRSAALTTANQTNTSSSNSTSSTDTQGKPADAATADDATLADTSAADTTIVSTKDDAKDGEKESEKNKDAVQDEKKATTGGLVIHSNTKSIPEFTDSMFFGLQVRPTVRVDSALVIASVNSSPLPVQMVKRAQTGPRTEMGPQTETGPRTETETQRPSPIPSPLRTPLEAPPPLEAVIKGRELRADSQLDSVLNIDGAEGGGEGDGGSEGSSDDETRVDSNEHDDFLHDIPTTEMTDERQEQRKDGFDVRNKWRDSLESQAGLDEDGKIRADGLPSFSQEGGSIRADAVDGWEDVQRPINPLVSDPSSPILEQSLSPSLPVPNSSPVITLDGAGDTPLSVSLNEPGPISATDVPIESKLGDESFANLHSGDIVPTVTDSLSEPDTLNKKSVSLVEASDIAGLPPGAESPALVDVDVNLDEARPSSTEGSEPPTTSSEEVLPATADDVDRSGPKDRPTEVSLNTGDNGPLDHSLDDSSIVLPADSQPSVNLEAPMGSTDISASSAALLENGTQKASQADESNQAVTDTVLSGPEDVAASVVSSTSEKLADAEASAQSDAAASTSSTSATSEKPFANVSATLAGPTELEKGTSSSEFKAESGSLLDSETQIPGPQVKSVSLPADSSTSSNQGVQLDASNEAESTASATENVMRSDDATTPTLANRPLPPDEAQDKGKGEAADSAIVANVPPSDDEGEGEGNSSFETAQDHTSTPPGELLVDVSSQHSAPRNTEPVSPSSAGKLFGWAERNLFQSFNFSLGDSFQFSDPSHTGDSTGNASDRSFPMPIKDYSHILAAARPLSRQSLSARDAVNGLDISAFSDSGSEEYFDSPEDPHEDGINFFVQ